MSDFKGICMLIWLLLLAMGTRPDYASSAFTREFLCGLSMYPSGLYINWTCKAQEQAFVHKGRYEAKQILITRFQMYRDSVFFVSPRFRCGVPFTLGFSSIIDYCRSEPLLNPFPSWRHHDYDNPDGFQNIIDIFLDSKNAILWALDLGVVNTLKSPVVVNAPRVLGICIKSKKLVHSINLSSVTSEKSRLQHLQVEETENGNIFVYVSDAGTNSILVWDLALNRGFKVLLPEMAKIGTTARDVLYISLIRARCGGTNLYFTYLNGKKMFHVRTCYIRECKTEGRIEDDGYKPGRTVILGTDSHETIFFRLKGESDIFMWNTHETFSLDNFILIDTVPFGRLTTQVAQGYKRLMWALSSNFPDFITEKLTAMGVHAKLHPIAKFCDQKK